MRISHLAEIGISKEEILTGYSLEWEQLTNNEKIYFNEQYNRGVLNGKARVAQSLVKQSNNNFAAALAYLRRFAENYEKDVDTAEASNSSGQFAFIFEQTAKDVKEGNLSTTASATSSASSASSAKAPKLKSNGSKRAN